MSGWFVDCFLRFLWWLLEVVDGGWIVVCVGDANTRGCGFVWDRIVAIGKVMVLIGVLIVLLSGVGIKVLDCFRMLA